MSFIGRYLNSDENDGRPDDSYCDGYVAGLIGNRVYSCSPGYGHGQSVAHNVVFENDDYLKGYADASLFAPGDVVMLYGRTSEYRDGYYRGMGNRTHGF